MRDIETAFQNQIEADSLKPAIFVKAEFDSGDLTLWTGLGEVTFNGDVYYGAGQVLGISQVEETQELTANNVTFAINGIDPALVAIAFNEDYQNRPITAWFVVFDDDDQIDGSYQIFSGKMDVMDMDTGSTTATISVSCESDLIVLKNSKVRRYTPEDQKIDYPDDKGFDFVPTIQDRPITWGAGRSD